MLKRPQEGLNTIATPPDPTKSTPIPKIVPGNIELVRRGPDEAFFMEASDSEEACLLVHGATGTAGDMHFLGEFLHRRGYNVQGLSLPGHERRQTALAGTSWQACYAMVHKAWLDLSGRYRRVHVVGFSLGGSLAIHLAANEKVENLVLLAPALFVYAKPRDVLLSVFGFVPRTAAYARLRWNLGLIRFFRQVRKDVTRLRCPFLLIHARDDATVRLKGSHAIYEHAPTTDRRLLILDRGGHLLPHGIAREKVWAEIERHLASHRCGSGAAAEEG